MIYFKDINVKIKTFKEFLEYKEKELTNLIIMNLKVRNLNFVEDFFMKRLLMQKKFICNYFFKLF